MKPSDVLKILVWLFQIAMAIAFLAGVHWAGIVLALMVIVFSAPMVILLFIGIIAGSVADGV